MKPLGKGSAKAARHRKFHWCRRPNGFSDMPVWRVVAGNLCLPLYQVVAFANRLEELGNAAANFGEVRGSVARFSAGEFGAALGMTSDECLRIFGELERPEIGWIAYCHIADFYDRNPDREDDTSAERQRRKRLRDTIQVQIAKLARLGKIDEPRRLEIEGLLGGSEAELRHLQLMLARTELSPQLSTTDNVTRDSRDISGGQKQLSTTVPVTRDSRMSRVTHARAEQSRVLSSGSVVDNFSGSAPGETAGSAELDEATLWIDNQGRQMLVDYLRIKPGLAETYIERWRRDLQDDVKLAEIIQAADKVGYIGSRFHTMITEQWRRHVATAVNGPQLPLMPPRPGQRKESA
jgi:hypothetical protein